MKKIRLTILYIILFSTLTSTAESINGIWGINFGDNQSQTFNKLKNHGGFTNIFPEDNNIVIENPRLGSEIFNSASFGFNNNQLESIIFSEVISYEEGFFQPLNIQEAKNWLNKNKVKVNSIIDNLVKSISQKYGSPVTGDSKAIATWKDDSGNFIEIVLQEVVNMGENRPGFYEQFGAMPGFIIAVHYGSRNIISDF